MEFEQINRPHVPELSRILGDPIRVLNGQGFIRLIDYMGDETAIVQAARVSYGTGTKKVSEDKALIRYLMRHHHTTPFEMCEIKLHLRVPMDCWRQWIRHRTASVNEYSTRYSEAIDEFQVTAPDEWRRQGKGNKQGSSGYLPSHDEKSSDICGDVLSSMEKVFHIQARQIYRSRLDSGVAREQARKDLPLSNFTEAYWKINLHNLLHFLQLRMDDHAQKEIREYATKIGHEIVHRWVPTVWGAFNQYSLNSLSLTEPDKMIIRTLNRSSEGVREAFCLANEYGWLKGKNNRERQECEVKLERLLLDFPWIRKEDRWVPNL